MQYYRDTIFSSKRKSLLHESSLPLRESCATSAPVRAINLPLSRAMDTHATFPAQ